MSRDFRIFSRPEFLKTFRHSEGDGQNSEFNETMRDFQEAFAIQVRFSVPITYEKCSLHNFQNKLFLCNCSLGFWFSQLMLDRMWPAKKWIVLRKMLCKISRFPLSYRTDEQKFAKARVRHYSRRSCLFHCVPSCSILFHCVPQCSILFHHVPSCSAVFWCYQARFLCLPSRISCITLHKVF